MPYHPDPDAIVFLSGKTALERHAIARVLEVDGPALEILGWLTEQPDCDLATASMIFWRLWALPVNEAEDASIEERIPVLEQIAQNVREGKYGRRAIAWDGLEAWDGTPLRSAPSSVELEDEIPPELSGPFDGGATPEPVAFAFLDSPYETDDIFDSLWRRNPKLIAAADWVIGKPQEVWMAAVDVWMASHPDEIFQWMVKRPECSASVAGQLFWLSEPQFYARQGLRGESVVRTVLERWRAGTFQPSDLDFRRYARPGERRQLDPLRVPSDLLEPAAGRPRAHLDLYEDFSFFCIAVDLGGLVPRPRASAIAEWRRHLANRPR